MQLVQQGGTAAPETGPQQGQWQYLRREADKLSHGAKEAGEDIQGAAVAEHGDHRKQADQGRGDGGGGLSPSLAPCKKQSNTSTPEQRPQLNRPVMSSGMNQALNDMECPPF